MRRIECIRESFLKSLREVGEPGRGEAEGRKRKEEKKKRIKGI